MQGRNLKKSILTVVEIILVFLAIIYFLIPLWWLIISSFKPIPEVYKGNPFMPTLNPSFEIFETLLIKTEGGLWLSNSVLYSAIAAIIASLSSLAAGYSFSKFNFRGRSFLYSIVAFSLTLPVIIVAVPTFILIKSIGWLDSIQGFVIPLSFSSFGVFLMKISVDSNVSDELLDAARIDGASEARIFFSIVLRLCIPTVLTLFVIHFIQTWNNLIYGLLILYTKERFILPQGMDINLYFGSRELAQSLSILIGGASATVLLMMALFLSLEKRIEESFQAGYGIKG
ncbi:MAG: carbohydrate ABC transporter permease [Nitrososphaerota archaeon]